MTNQNQDNQTTSIDSLKLTEKELATNAKTWEHIDLVMRLLASAQIDLMRRQFTHDRSKLRPPEVSTFAEVTPKLANLTYGSDEYKEMLASMKPALDHHYSHNRHHPEFFESRKKSNVINSHIVMAKWAANHGQVLPDDIHGYENLIKFLDKKQIEHQSSINNMNLFDVLEMLLDWYAATKRHNDGDIWKSIEINKDRFGISDQLVEIFKNTIQWMNDEFEDYETQKDLPW